jgi:hypothetical protein
MKAKALYFIHGLGGHYQKTWQTFLALLEADPAIGAGYDFFSFGFPTSLIRIPFMRKSLRVQDLALGVRTDVEHRLKSYTEIIMIGHSLGGIIARKYLIELTKSETETNVKGLVLFAEPVNGSTLAAVAKYISWRHWHIKQLCRDSETLESINGDWHSLKLASRLRVSYVYGGQDVAVDRSSVVSSVHRDYVEMIPDASHTSIIRPTSSTDMSYLVLRNFLVEQPKIGKHPRDRATFVTPDPLFDRYTSEQEPYYISRREDLLVSGYLDSVSLWVSGVTGVGKSSSILRALHLSGYTYKYVSLGNFSGSSVKGLFSGISYSLTTEDSRRVPMNDDISWPDLIHHVVTDICSLRNTGCRFLLVEEIPLRVAEDFDEFISRFCALLLYSSDICQGLDFILSSLHPVRVDRLTQRDKVIEQVKFLEFGRWRASDITKLIGTIGRALGLQLDDWDITQLAKAAAGSPRFVKIFFREFRQLQLMGSVSVDQAIAHTRREVG